MLISRSLPQPVTDTHRHTDIYTCIVYIYKTYMYAIQTDRHIYMYVYIFIYVFIYISDYVLSILFWSYTGIVGITYTFQTDKVTTIQLFIVKLKQ